MALSDLIAGIHRPNDLERMAAEESLHAFVRLAWPILEPGTRFIDGRHIHAICEALEACERGEIRNLLINIPPRCAKSLLVSVFFPAWAWTRKPQLRYLFASYAQSLSIRDSLKCRRLIESPWYQRNWGERVSLNTDQNQKIRFENSAMGYRLATSVGGTATGEGGDYIAVDDCHNVEQALSEVQREGALIWWDETMSTRLNDPKTGRKIIVMQRLHERDLSGHVLAQGGYVHLCLPMEFEPARRCVIDLPGYQFADWRREAGELLWPERFGPDEVEGLKRALGAYGAAGQLQQAPAPRGGGLFQRDWFPVIERRPDGLAWMRYWDLASTAERAVSPDPDWSVGALVGYGADRVIIADIQRMRGGDYEVEQRIRHTAGADGQEVPIVIEQEPGSSGKSLVNHLIRGLAGYHVRGHRPSGRKEDRWAPLASLACAGGVSLVRGEWIHEFLAEAEVAPAGAHDDQLDAVSGALSLLSAGEDRRMFKMLTDQAHMMFDQPRIMPLRDAWGLIVPGYIDPEGHEVIRPVELARAIIQGTAGPCGCLWAAIDEDYDWTIYRVYKQRGWGAKENAREIARLSGQEVYRFDLIDSRETAPDNWGRSEDLFAEYTDADGNQPLLTLEPVRFRAEDRAEGVNTVRSMLLAALAIEQPGAEWWRQSGQDPAAVEQMAHDSALFIAPSCRALYEELDSMRYRPPAGADAGARPSEQASSEEELPLAAALRMLAQAALGDLIRRR